MRKLLVLMLVFGLASMANAALRISVNDNKNPTDSDYTLRSSETITLDIWTDATIPILSVTYWVLVVDTTMGRISDGVCKYPDDAVIWPDAALAGIRGLPSYSDGVWGLIAVFSPAGIPANAVIYDEIIFQCKGVGDAVVELYTTDLVGTNTVVDSVVIHQIPEPMTIALLGFGGLLLRRRRK